MTYGSTGPAAKILRPKKKKNYSGAIEGHKGYRTVFYRNYLVEFRSFYGRICRKVP
jgi:hypothetical protein